MSSLKITTAAAALAALAAPALAGGFAQPQPYIAVPTPTVIPEPGQDWTGPSVQLRLGYGATRYSLPDGQDDDDDDDEFVDSGILYGLGAAYDFDFGNVVAGVTASVDATGIDTALGDVERVARIGGRVGADFGNSWVYVAGGYAQAYLDGAAGDLDDGGYYAGIGSEIRLTQSLSLGAEVLYHKFDDFDGSGIDVDAVTSVYSLNLRF